MPCMPLPFFHATHNSCEVGSFSYIVPTGVGTMRNYKETLQKGCSPLVNLHPYPFGPVSEKQCSSQIIFLRGPVLEKI